MSRPVDVTVAVCTRGRPERLSRTVASMEDLAVPPTVRWELLVVDNGRRPSAAAALESRFERLPLRIAREETPGLSAARNRAVGAARGEYIAWTDDDVLVDEGWLASYWRAFRRWEDAAFFGGPIDLRFDGDPPPWLPSVLPRVASAYARRDLGDEPFRFAAGSRELPYGANFAVRSDVQRAFGFDPRLGRRPGGVLVGGEELDVFRRMLRAGLSGRWVPGSRVTHVIPRERQSLRYLRRHLEGDALEEERASPTRGLPRARRICRYVLRAVRDEALFRWHRLRASPERWIRDLEMASDARGRLRALLAPGDGDRPAGVGEDRRETGGSEAHGDAGGS